MLLKDLLAQIPGVEWTEKTATEISGISYDSRSVQQGDLFVAIKGEKADGARFISQAVHNGAVAVAARGKIVPDPETAAINVPDARKFLADISRLFYGDPSAKLKLVGITGTQGKTTTSYLLEAV